MIDKSESGSKTLRILLAFGLLLSFRTLEYFPGMTYVQESWYVLCFLALLIVYPISKILNGFEFYAFEIYVLILMLVDVLWPAWRAHQVFGQPLYYGVLRQRASVLMGVPLLMFIAMRSRWMSPQYLESTLLLLSWGTFILYSMMLLFLNPADFLSTAGRFVLYVKGSYLFVLHTDFIAFGMIYYAFLALRGQGVKYYIAAAILFVGVVDNSDARAFMVSLAVMFLYILYRRFSFGNFIKYIAIACTVAAVTLALGFALKPDYMSARIAGFADAFKVVFTASEVEDPSAGIRLVEGNTALPYIQKNPLLGNGAISHQWQNSPEDVSADVFFPDDIGVLGIIFAVGVIGLFVYAYQFRLAIWASRRIPERLRSPLSDAAAGYLLVFGINSVSTGSFFYFPEISLFFIAILVAIAYDGIRETQRIAKCKPTAPPLT